MEPVSLPEFKGSDWDEGDVNKNWESHQVSPHEAEQGFFNHPLIVADDVKHSGTEHRTSSWAEHDSTDFVDWSRAKRGVFPNLKPSTKTISLRLPESMLEELKLLANKNDVPCQSLVKVFPSERIESEMQKHAPRKIKS